MKVLGKLLLIIYVFRDGRTQARNPNHAGGALNLPKTSNADVQPHRSRGNRAPIADARVFTENENNLKPTDKGVSLSVESVDWEGVEHDGSDSSPRNIARRLRKEDSRKHNAHRQLETDFKDLEDVLQEIATKDPREWTAAEWLVMLIFLSFMSWLGCCLLSLCCCGRRGSNVLGCLCLYEICCRDGQDIDRCCDYAMAT